MSDVGYLDAEPEDAYDEGDCFEEKLDVLERAVENIRTNVDERRETRRLLVVALVELIEARATEFRLRVATLRENLDAL